MILFKNCELYAPDYLSLNDLLIAGTKIEAIGNNMTPGCHGKPND